MKEQGRNPRVGVLAESRAQVDALAHAVSSHGYELLACDVIRNLDAAWSPICVDVWLADLGEKDEGHLDVLLDTGTPVLLGIEHAPQPATQAFTLWERRVYTKLRGMVGAPKLDAGLAALDAEDLKPGTRTQLIWSADSSRNSGCYVCVLAASLGGPEAVKEFLDNLPEGLPVAFILAQHIDGRMLDILPRVLGRHNHFHIRIATDGEELKPAEVLIAPVEQELDFDEHGRIHLCGRPWQGPYAPSMDQVLANVSRAFGKQSLAVIFSGMGSDGSMSGPDLIKRGGRILAQDAASCACSSQPDSMRARGCVSDNGRPAELASKLVDYLKSVYQQNGAVH